MGLLRAGRDALPDRRRHRSAAPGDSELFGPAALENLRAAAADLAWLRTRGYAERAALALVGNRFGLRARQREAIARATCSEEQRRARGCRAVAGERLRGARVAIDGFNLLTTLESALGGGVVLLSMDGCARDLARLSGTWRRVVETRPALELAGAHLARCDLAGARWWLDAPVSNSGRLAALLRELAAERAWPWEVEVARHVDRELVRTPDVVASADSGVLDACGPWWNLAREIVATVEGAWRVDLCPP